MGGKSDPPPPPDYSGIAAASEASAKYAYELGQDQLEWAREQYASDKEIVDRVVSAALDMQRFNMDNAAYDRARYQDRFQPLEDQLIADAKSFASQERKDKEMGEAAASVGQQFTAARNAATQNLEAFGVDPSSTRYAALDIGMRASEAAAKAAAANQAADMVDAQGRAIRSEAINVGRGYPGQIAGTYATALQGGNQAVNSQLAGTASGANTMGTGAQWQGLGNQALGVWGNTLNMGYNNQLNAYNAEQNSSSGLGGLFGTVLGGAMKYAFEDGGAVPTTGGKVPAEASPTQGGAVDDVPARLNVGEFVVPKDAVAWKGEEFFQKLIEKSRQDREKATAKPELAVVPAEQPTFVSRPTGALPVG